RKENNALMQLVVEPGVGHGHNASKSWTIVLAFIKTLFALRVPQDADLAKGPVKLKAIKEADGWLGQNWNAQTGGYQKLPIAAYADFSGDKAQASWLPTADYARQWQEFQNAGFIERW
ncbi:MAG: hypothetical protein Q8O57_00405, partial [Kiritimatiellota bacterium]|nr:hypothetical protein [Kiritimatiellota bacterium]